MRSHASGDHDSCLLCKRSGAADQSPDHVIKSPPGGLELEFIPDISPQDGMNVSTRDVYYRFGLAALAYIRLALQAAGDLEPRNILDLPSGYGRVLRMLKAAYPDADLTACDIDRAAVDFCAETFDAIPAYSTEDVSDLRLAGHYDLIWCGSLLTHLGAEGWSRFLAWFEQHLRKGGVLVFTTHGRLIADEVRSGRRRFSVRDLSALVAAYERDGFGYEPYVDPERDNGISLSSPAWVCKKLERCPSLELLTYTERGWNGRQDAVTCVRRP
jgi:SAM-dependent methyltransferase